MRAHSPIILPALLALAGLLPSACAPSRPVATESTPPSSPKPKSLEGTIVLRVRVGEPSIAGFGHGIKMGFNYHADDLSRHPIAAVGTDQVNPWWKVPCRIQEVVSNGTAIVISDEFSLYIHSPTMTFCNSSPAGSDYEITLQSYHKNESIIWFRLQEAKKLQ